MNIIMNKGTEKKLGLQCKAANKIEATKTPKWLVIKYRNINSSETAIANGYMV